MAESGESLSDRELAVLECLVDGSTNREIAQNLHISHNTVKVHLRNIFVKLDVNSRTEATAVALQKGLLSLPGLESVAEEEESPALETPGAEEFDVQIAEEPVTDRHNIMPAVREHAPPEIRNTPIGTPAPPVQTLPWRTISLALGGLVIVIFLLFLAFQFIGEGVINIPGFNSNGQEAEEEPAALNVQIGESRWFSAPAMPRPASNMALVAIGLNLYQIGGEVEAGVVNLVNIYETDSGQWRSGAAKPTAVADVTAAVLFGEIFVPGGRLADGRPTSVVEAYSPANNAWRQVAPLPVPISGGLTLSDGRLLYLFGGWDGAGYLAEGFVYDPATDAWRSLPSMPTGRAFAAGGFLLGNLYVVGGQNEQGELAVCESFDPIAQSWHECPALTRPRAGAGAAVLVAADNNSLYIIGGGVEEQTLDSEFFSDETGGWQPVEMPMLEDDSWHHLAVTNVETRIYALGGRQGGAILETVYVYSPLINRIYFPSVADDR